MSPRARWEPGRGLLQSYFSLSNQNHRYKLCVSVFGVLNSQAHFQLKGFTLNTEC